jgi:predicted nucleic acid-binding protein
MEKIMTVNSRKIVFLDTCVFSAYLFLNRNEVKENKLARKLIEDLTNQKAEIFIPLPALQEVLICCSDGKRMQVYSEIEKLFKLADFNTLCTKSLIELLDYETFKAFCAEGAVRDHIRTDQQIVSIALHYKADCIYSSDPHFPKYADGKIEIIDYLELEYADQPTFKFPS